MRAILVIAALFPFVAGAQAPNKEAARLFERYVALGRAFDAKLADMYDDNALIRHKRTSADGAVREVTVPAQQYKSLLREELPRAQARGDRSTYSNVRYAREGERVRVSAARYSELRKYSSPLVLVVGPAAGGRWLIYEEHSESRR